jgi:hypothetical protein
MFSGPVYDVDRDGLKDSDQQIVEMYVVIFISLIVKFRAKNKPTHVFFILLRCKSEWHKSSRYCEKSEETRVMAFVFPLLNEDFNCLYPMEYILRHSARVRDIELLTGIEFFLDRTFYPPDLAIQLRTQQVESLWQMEHPTES